MERTRREESLSFKEKMGRLLADARAGKRQLEYRDIFRYFRPKELKEEEPVSYTHLHGNIHMRFFPVAASSGSRNNWLPAYLPPAVWHEIPPAPWLLCCIPSLEE